MKEKVKTGDRVKDEKGVFIVFNITTEHVHELGVTLPEKRYHLIDGRVRTRDQFGFHKKGKLWFWVFLKSANLVLLTIKIILILAAWVFYHTGLVMVWCSTLVKSIGFFLMFKRYSARMVWKKMPKAYFNSKFMKA